ncbi:MAG TPA: Hsp20/alpha crystallin family protein [Gammaproteobacteria bacterium]|nr:Hsp20/alpha crystallin family protein [Gammaproteobacteria bacterium]
MALVRYEPWGIGQLQSEINRLFSSFGDGESSGVNATWVPPVDIYEHENRFQLYMDLPGVDPASVDITLEAGVLTVTGERMHFGGPQDVNDRGDLRRNERGLGRFYRRFVLPDSVDSERVEATNRHGVLELTIPKQAKALPRRIKVAA